MTGYFKVRPLNVGAEIYDIAGDPTDPAMRSALYETWMEYGLIKLTDVTSMDLHIEISRAFGELEIHPLVSMRAPENDLFMSVSDEIGPPYVYDDEVLLGTIPWHRDTAYMPDLAKGALLRITETPPTAGETWFADTAKAYDDLPEDIKTALAGLEWVAVLKLSPMAQSGPGAIWRTVRELTDEEWRRSGLDRSLRQTTAIGEKIPPVVHPAMITHPESGRKCIFLSPKDFDYFLGMSRADSDGLFDQLCKHMLQDKYVYKQIWKNNDVMGWDNRRMMHAATGSHVGDTRRGLRTTLAGDLSAGRWLDLDKPADASGPVQMA